MHGYVCMYVYMYIVWVMYMYVRTVEVKKVSVLLSSTG